MASVSRRIRGGASPRRWLRVDAKFARNGGGFLARVVEQLFCEVSGPHRTLLTMVVG